MKLQRIIFIYGLILFFGTEFSISQVNSDSLISVYTKKIQKYLDKDNKASEVFSFTKTGIEVYSPATDSAQKKFEYGIMWSELDLFRELLSSLDTKTMVKLCRGKSDPFPEAIKTEYAGKSTSSVHPPVPSKKSLSGIRIALDPGHIAGDLEAAKMEKKWVEMKNPPVELIEGELTLATANILKTKLEEQGAKVMLTRTKPGISSFGIDYKKWKDSLFVRAVAGAYERGDIDFEEKNYLLTKANDTEIFRRFFLLEDLRERAKKINEFHPDLTVVIHFNVDETNSNWNKPTKKDYNMCFVGGGFTDDELEKPEDRLEFLRLLLTDDIERSVEFSTYMMESLVEKTGVPAAIDSNAVYLRDNCMDTEVKGVFCRNLTLTRKVNGVICYGESLYQDNINECRALSKKEIKIDGMETSKRVGDVAAAYLEGILNYVKNRKGNR